MQNQYNELLWSKVNSITIRGIYVRGAGKTTQYIDLETIITPDQIYHVYNDLEEKKGWIPCQSESNRWCLNTEDARLPIFLLIPCVSFSDTIELDRIRLINVEYDMKGNTDEN